MTDYGSGALGDYSGLTHSISSNWTQLDDPEGSPRPRVGFLGDSIGNRGRTKLASMLMAEFGADMAWDCWSGAPATPLVDAQLARNLWPEVLLFGLGTNNCFDPPSFAGQIQRLIDAAPASTTIVAIDTYVARASVTDAVKLHDVRNSGWVNDQIHAALPPERVVDWVANLGYAVGRGRALSYYLEDGVHPWTAAGTGHANGVDFWAEIVMQTLRPLL
jgi:hypothetical protein